MNYSITFLSNSHETFTKIDYIKYTFKKFKGEKSYNIGHNGIGNQSQKGNWKSWSFEKINNTNKLLAKQIKKKERKWKLSELAYIF